MRSGVSQSRKSSAALRTVFAMPRRAGGFDGGVANLNTASGKTGKRFFELPILMGRARLLRPGSNKLIAS
jgi:hypothetical protein